MVDLDLTNVNCPLVVLKTKKFLSSMSDINQLLHIQSVDSTSLLDLQDFCHKTGHKIKKQYTQDSIIHTIIKHKDAHIKEDSCEHE